MICHSCSKTIIGRHSNCPHCGVSLAGGLRVVTDPYPEPAETALPIWRNINDKAIVNPQFVGQTEPPSYRQLRWIRDDKLITPFLAAAASGEIMITQVPVRERWRILRAIYIGPTANTLFKLYAGGSSYPSGDGAPGDLFDVNKTLSGAAITTDVDKALIPAGANLRATFSGATLNDQVIVILYYDVYILETRRERPGGGASEAMD